MLSEKNSFLGRGWGFPPEFPQRGASVNMVDGDDNVRQSLEILLQTAKFTRLMHPDFYCDLQAYVFHGKNSQTLSNIKHTIAAAILQNEPRVDCGDILVTSNKDTPDVLQIQVNYMVRSTNSRQNIVFPFYLNEGTDLPAFAASAADGMAGLAAADNREEQ